MKNNLSLELYWWIFTALVVAAVLFPIYSQLDSFPFYPANIIFIVTFITLTRYIFLLQFTFLARRQLLKVALIFVSIPAVFLLIQELHRFQTYLDEEGVEAIIGPISSISQENLISYIRSEMLLFAVGSIISGVLFPFRMVISVWRVRNEGKV